MAAPDWNLRSDLLAILHDGTAFLRSIQKPLGLHVGIDFVHNRALLFWRHVQKNIINRDLLSGDCDLGHQKEYSMPLGETCGPPAGDTPWARCMPATSRSFCAMKALRMAFFSAGDLLGSPRVARR